MRKAVAAAANPSTYEIRSGGSLRRFSASGARANQVRSAPGLKKSPQPTRHNEFHSRALVRSLELLHVTPARALCTAAGTHDFLIAPIGQAAKKMLETCVQSPKIQVAKTPH
jgi:hypothetical protein